MPGNVAVAAPATVLPNTLCSAFSETRSWSVIESADYRDGYYQATAQGTTSRKAWELAKLVTFAQWVTLLAFFDARNGGQEPFYWYPLIADYDATGVSTTGRWTVRFEGSLSRQYQPGRQQIGLRLVQVS